MVLTKRRNPTIRDVAAHAGVSFKSVSNVINDHPYVSVELRDKVERSIAALGYRPNSVARSLASQRTNLIGLVLRTWSDDGHADPFLSQFLVAACDAAGAQGFGVLVQVADDPIIRAADVFGHRQVDGLIDFSPRIDDIPEAADDDVPVVHIGRVRPGSNALAVDADNEQGAFMAVSHLIALGHRRIGMVANADLSYTVSTTRVEGYRQALHVHDLPFVDRLLTMGNFSLQSGFDAMRRLLDLPEPPTAVFVSSDRMALGAMHAIHERGLRIPDDMAVVGFDDLFISAHAAPPLTTVLSPIDDISTRATEILIDAIRGKPIEPRQVVLPTKLVVRRSCGAPEEWSAATLTA